MLFKALSYLIGKSLSCFCQLLHLVNADLNKLHEMLNFFFRISLELQSHVFAERFYHVQRFIR